MTVVVGTAGHIDHGKTTLLRALTGIDADRLPEERARGMTIDVGYAHLALDDDTELDFVDVPGHDRLVGNMLVGAGEVDAALLVVAADDGPRAQTIEHLELLDALGIDHGLVVVTKSDAVPEGRATAVADAARQLLLGTTLGGAPVLAASAITGTGLDDVRRELLALRDRVGRTAARPSGARLSIDRVFSVRGRGTVVTGTLRGASIERGAQLRVVPGDAGLRVRVREIQVHGRAVEIAGPGRVALNLAGSDAVARLARGTILTTDPSVVPSDRILVALRPGGRRAAPRDRTPVTLHLGTDRVAGTVGRSRRDAADLDHGEVTAILRLARPIGVAPGDRFVLRRPSPAETLAGGRVLDAQPPRGAARRRSTDERLRALAGAPPGAAAWVRARVALHGITPAGDELAADVAAAVDAALASVVADGGGEARVAVVLAGGMAELRRQVGPLDGRRAVAGRLDALVADGRLEREADRVRLPGRPRGTPPPELAAAMDRLVDLLASPAPPSLAEAARRSGCPPAGVRALEQANRIVRLDDDLAWAFPTYRDLAGRALAMAASEPLTPAAFRDATGTSRKYVMAILEDLDRRAILRRTPAGHVPGPRAPQAGAAQPREQTT
ncbi:MAG TPA: selenocysteine-specific translation elongation factor [Candidatus Limnocylindrales bacterium]|nr:selenocysteine-specific translation elongation factor [Candidatus Limnocylindrales bacterium]